MSKEEMLNIKKVYVYNRLKREITECDVYEIDSCCFAKFKYNLEGSKYTDWYYDLRNGVVRLLDRSFCPPVEYILVSYDKRTLGWIKESDEYMLIRLKSKLLKNIVEKVFK